MMGGVASDLEGRTSVEDLYVIGETAYTGLHGANRLASNSLLECLVLSQQAAQHIIHRSMFKHVEAPLRHITVFPHQFRFQACETLKGRLTTLHQLMWKNAGIVREEAPLLEALKQINLMEDELLFNQWQWVVPEGVEYHNQLKVARLIVEAAYVRKESRGAHYRTDYPEPSTQAKHSHQAKMKAIA
jgi:L-aspartate oxidase